MPVKALFLVNEAGRVRLTRVYDDMQAKDVGKNARECWAAVSKRAEDASQFLEATVTTWGKQCHIVYQHYQPLYLMAVVDGKESELAILDTLSQLYTALDAAFATVCEVDILQQIDKVNYLVDQFIANGHVIDTKHSRLLAAMRDSDDPEQAWNDYRLFQPGAASRLEAGAAVE